MRVPSVAEINSFIAGMEYALELAEDQKNGKFSRQSHAIRKEVTHLKLLSESACDIAPAVAPEVMRQPLRITRIVSRPSRLHVIGECAAAAIIVLFPFAFLWVTYFFNGSPVDFGGGQ